LDQCLEPVHAGRVVCHGDAAARFLVGRLAGLNRSAQRRREGCRPNAQEPSGRCAGQLRHAAPREARSEQPLRLRPPINLTVANLLCYLRLAAIPVLLALAALDLHKAFLWLLAAAWATDAIDGPLARRLRQETVRGARLDS